MGVCVVFILFLIIKNKNDIFKVIMVKEIMVEVINDSLY